jgi:glycosyltransferase involved in cell wall biosynthesis
MNSVEQAPVFSVITPVFNGVRYIERSYAMLAAQTFQDWEWVVVDDGSTDGTGDRVRAIPDPRIRLVAYSPNRGRGYARSRALEAARGEWMVVWDADDLYFPDRLERLDRARRAGFDFCCSYAVVVDNAFRVKGVRGFFPPYLGLPRCFVHHTLGCRLDLARRIGYDPAFHTGEDPMLVWVLSAQWRGEYVPDALTVYVEEHEISPAKAIRSHSARLVQLYRIWRGGLVPLGFVHWLILSGISLTKIGLLQMMRLMPWLYRATLCLRSYGETVSGYALPEERRQFIARVGKGSGA